MASSSTINQWMEELVISILPALKTPTRHASRRHLDGVKRRIKHHSFARTNQFDVNDRLKGLEEKFQILNRDDLSDALYDRCNELRTHHQQWIPDVLDLLLRLSNDPVHQTKYVHLSDVTRSSDESADLKWADIEGEDFIDRGDPIWEIPVFSDLSSNEDEVEVSTVLTSPASTRQKQHVAREKLLQESVSAFQSSVVDTSKGLVKCLKPPLANDNVVVTEIQLVKQCLLAIQGLPSVMFESTDRRMRLTHWVRTQHLPNRSLQALSGPFTLIRSNLEVVKRWIAEDFAAMYMQVVKQHVERGLRAYISAICAMEESLMHPSLVQTASLLHAVDRVEVIGRPLCIMAQWIDSIQNMDPIACLNAVYEAVSQYDLAGDEIGVKIMLPTFLEALRVYFKPVRTWLATGILDPKLGPFFVASKKSSSAKGNLWHDHYELHKSGPSRAPSFLDRLAPKIFSCGKTVAFANHISEDESEALILKAKFDNFVQSLHMLASDSAIPFPVAFLDAMNQFFTQSLASATLRLRALLEKHCKFSQTFDAFEYVYLHKNGALLDIFENRIFDHIDRCLDDWNDRFLIADILQDVYQDVDCISLESIIVQAARTSSRSMESRRRSVRILGALAVDYALPWPIANIIPRTSLNAYRRVALHLSQIRRSKHVLERIAYTQVNSTSIGDGPRDQMLVQVTTFMLIQFVNTLYDHFTTGLVLPLTTQMRHNLRSADSVDAMIHVHQTYVTALEFTCLVSKPLKMLRETLIGLLDMCIRFADLVCSNTRAARRGSDDFENSSFISAQSQRNKKSRRAGARAQDVDSSSDDDDEFGGEGEGYSSFIVLDEDTTVMQEIGKLQVQFRRQLDFFVAGLRGVARGGGTVEEFERLADRLDWKDRSSP